jgi:alpha-glucosidase (family GH31 glycosyl hydrolase)
VRLRLGPILLAAATLIGALPASAQAQANAPIIDGAARFEVITPSLIRLEYAADGSFEDRSTLTTDGQRASSDPVAFETKVHGNTRIIRTSQLTLRWRRDSGPFAAGSLRLRVGKRKLMPQPGPNPRPLGGWRRSLDLTGGQVLLHEGMLSRAGWYLLDDSETALVSGNHFEVRPGHAGDYQDLYLFAYGHDYARGLRDLRTLTGPAPMLPRKAFGVWFSRWWPYGADDWHDLVGRFRDEHVPLDTISIDTDYKSIDDPVAAAAAAQAVGAPNSDYSWNGWGWNRELYPHPREFLSWARSAGLEVGLNIHPSISSTDPRFDQTQAEAGGGLTADPECQLFQADPSAECMVFDWTDPKQLAAYFELHRPFEKDGPVFWWLDWCCDGSSADAPGLTPDTWINRAYSRRQRARGIRWPAFSRIGGSRQGGAATSGGTGAFAEHRYSIQFTGDTCARWPLIAFASEFTASAASIGMPYVSHDIGTFHGTTPVDACNGGPEPLLKERRSALPSDMYARWVQFGTFQPLDRLHSNHGHRLPWEYPEAVGRIASRFLRLRGRLAPYLYSLAAVAHRTGLPMARALYLQWPGRNQSYEHPSQYTLGRDMLVAPVSKPGESPSMDVWFPPGTWVDWFTGERHEGPGTEQLDVPLSRMPVFVRAGGIVPMQDNLSSTPVGPPRSIVLFAQSGTGGTSLYDDSGRGFSYESGKSTLTRITQRRSAGVSDVTIDPARGGFASAPRTRSYELRLEGIPRPGAVTVAGKPLQGWSYEAASRTVIIETGAQPTSSRLRIRIASR